MILRLKIAWPDRKGSMRHIFITFSFLISLMSMLFSFSVEAKNLSEINLKKNIKEKILKGEIFCESKVSEPTKTEQQLNFNITGLHPKSCAYALKKLSLYENYNQFLDFVKESKYNNETKELNFLLSHILLPFDMRLIFKLDRITKEGDYNFFFDQGFLKGLTGKIYVSEENKRCLFHSEVYWRGKDTKIPNKILEMFSQTLSVHTMTKLFRMSSTLAH